MQVIYRHDGEISSIWKLLFRMRQSKAESAFEVSRLYDFNKDLENYIHTHEKFTAVFKVTLVIKRIYVLDLLAPIKFQKDREHIDSDLHGTCDIFRRILKLAEVLKSWNIAIVLAILRQRDWSSR